MDAKPTASARGGAAVFKGVLVTIFCGLFRYNIVIQKLNYADIS